MSDSGDMHLRIINQVSTLVRVIVFPRSREVDPFIIFLSKVAEDRNLRLAVAPGPQRSDLNMSTGSATPSRGKDESLDSTGQMHESLEKVVGNLKK
jgi:hypothetical protein